MLRSCGSRCFKGAKKLLRLGSSSTRESSYFTLLEQRHHQPFARNGTVIILLNRSLMMGPRERKSMHLQVKSFEGQIRSVVDLTRQSTVRFSAKTDGIRV